MSQAPPAPVGAHKKDVRVVEIMDDHVDDETRQIYRMMVIADKTLLPHSMMVKLAQDPRVSCRTFMVDWMMREHLSQNSCEIRDTSIRIMDTFLAMTYATNPSKLCDHTFLAFVGATSMILSSKLHQSQHPITAACFAVFNTEELACFEREVVLHAGAHISPLSIPSSYLPYVLRHVNVDDSTRQKLAELTIQIIGEFLENSLSMLFAPSTIAVSAVLVSLSYRHLPVDAFLSSLPQFLLTSANQPFFQHHQDMHRYLDVRLCMEAMSQPPIQRVRATSNSPSAVWSVEG